MTVGTASAPDHTTPSLRLWNRGFVALVVAMFLIFCNMAVFFEFYDYLKYLKLPPASLGIIIGVFALVALFARPFLSMVLNPTNARLWIIVGTVGVVVSLLFYGSFTSYWGLVTIRVVHGLFYVLLATASMAALVACIPPDKSGQAFGLLAVVTILPYAVVPPLAENMHAGLADYPDLLAQTGLAMLLIVPLVFLVPRGGDGSSAPKKEGRLKWAEVAANLKDRRVSVLLGVSLLMFTAFTSVFYFINSYAEQSGVRDAGWFFTSATATEIAVRLFLGRLFDRLPKHKLLSGALALLAGAYLVLPAAVGGLPGLLVLAVFFGLGWGMAMPLFNALLFDLSPPRLKALNANLGLQMFQGGFFLGPFLGAWLIQGVGYRGLFFACGGVCLLGAVLVLMMVREGAQTIPGGLPSNEH